MATILLVQPDELNRDLLSRRLQRRGYQLVLCGEAKEGLARARAANPDVILMDLGLPGMDAWEATQLLKATPATSHIPVIGLAPPGQGEDLRPACDEYEVKPVDVARLLGKVERLMATRRSAPPAALPVETACPSGAKASLLVVSTAQVGRNVLCGKLEREGYCVAGAATAREAREVSQIQAFDLLILTLDLPGNDATEFVQEIRQSHPPAELPIIVLAPGVRAAEVPNLQGLGANDYLPLPVNFPGLLSRIQTHLALRHAAVGSTNGHKTGDNHWSPSTGDAIGDETPPRLSTSDTVRLKQTAPDLLLPPEGMAASTGEESTEHVHQLVMKAAQLEPEALPSVPGYEVLGLLGRGGMGVVYKARHEKMGRLVALKVINKEHLAHPGAVRRFYREVRAAAQLSHPNIVLAYDAGQFGDKHFFAMEYVEGVNLRQRVEQDGPLPPAEACDYIRQAALGLQHASERGLVHRDIKPSNLLITGADGTWRPGDKADAPPCSTARVKILDLGVALLSDGTGSHTGVSNHGRVVGTADYMAPEQWMDSHAVDIRADLYSLGCTFYFLLTGKVPFPTVMPMEKMIKHSLEEPIPVENHRPEVPPAVADIVRILMAKNPEDRFQKPADLAEALVPFCPRASVRSA